VNRRQQTAFSTDQLDPAQMELYKSIINGPRGVGKQHFPLTDSTGALNGPFGVMLHAPLIGKALQNLGAAIRFNSSLSDRVREIAILRVAVVEESEFEWFAHEPVARAAGLADTELDFIRNGSFTSETEAEQAAYDLVDALLHAGDVSDQSFEETALRIGLPQIYELTVLVGYYRTLAQSMRLFGIGLPDVESA
jgi:4-carboxymuconolactone decarboxylase